MGAGPALLAAGPPDRVRFGSSVALDRDTLVVGAEWDGPGSVHVYR